MVSTLVSFSAASNAVVGIAAVGCIILAAAMELIDGENPALKLINRHLTAFSVPVLMLFAFIVIVWAVRIITG